MLPSCSAAMPMPSSLTLATSVSFSMRAASAIRPPGGVNLTALTSRLPNTCERRSGSPSIQTGSGGSSTLRTCSMRSASGRAASAASCSSAVASTRSGCRFSLPRVTRLASSRSSIRRTRWVSWRSTMARAPAKASPSVGAIFMIAIALLIGASGLRSSCASIATNSSLRRAASRS